MPPQPEAECLLATGAMYTRRIGLRPVSGDLVFAGGKRGAFSLYEGDEPIHHFDLEGRWQRAFRDGVHYRKGLDDSVAAIERIREGANLVLHRRTLAGPEVADLDESIRGTAARLLGQVDSAELALVNPPEGVTPMGVEALKTMLAKVAAWDAAAWRGHRDRYRATYGPIGFLPPDAHQSIVLQATAEGGIAAESAARSAGEFADHLRSVAALWGARAVQANGVFLGGPDALRRPLDELSAMFDLIRGAFAFRDQAAPVRPRDLPEDEASLGGIDALVRDFRPGLPDREGWAMLGSKGLRRVNLVLPTSPAGPSRLPALVADLKAAGLAVALIVPAGRDELGGRIASEAASLAPLPLGPGDLVYLIDAAEIDPEGGHADQAAAAEQGRRLLAALGPVFKGKGAKVVLYTVEKQWN